MSRENAELENRGQRCRRDEIQPRMTLELQTRTQRLNEWCRKRDEDSRGEVELGIGLHWKIWFTVSSFWGKARPKLCELGHRWVIWFQTRKPSKTSDHISDMMISWLGWRSRVQSYPVVIPLVILIGYRGLDCGILWSRLWSRQHCSCPRPFSSNPWLLTHVLW